MLVEINGKGGGFCDQVKRGKLRCPLRTHPRSEDVVTSYLWGALQCINARWWLPDLLNTALGEGRFRRKIFRRLNVSLWERQTGIPKYSTPWSESATEVDVVVKWENPPTTVFVEMKYGSPLAKSTAASSTNSQFPNDQLIRNVRVGLWKCDWFQGPRLFQTKPRNFYTVVMAPNTGNELVAKYQSNQVVRSSLPNSKELAALPAKPFVGELSFHQLIQILRKNSRHFTRSEVLLADQLKSYLAHKLYQARGIE